MHYIKIGGDPMQYAITSIEYISTHVIAVEFDKYIPEVFGDIQVFTGNGIQYSNLPGFKTVYRDEGKKVYLSDDESIYREPEAPEEIIPVAPYEPTMEEVMTTKLREVNAACAAAITGGVTVQLSDGREEHFELKEEDQLAMLLSATEVAAGSDRIPWHPNGDKTMPCVFYNNADMAIITSTAKAHISYHQTYCNSLKIWIEACKTKEEVRAVSYGAEIPEEYQSEVLKAYVEQQE